MTPPVARFGSSATVRTAGGCRRPARQRRSPRICRVEVCDEGAGSMKTQRGGTPRWSTATNDRNPTVCFRFPYRSLRDRYGGRQRARLFADSRAAQPASRRPLSGRGRSQGPAVDSNDAHQFRDVFAARGMLPPTRERTIHVRRVNQDPDDLLDHLRNPSYEPVRRTPDSRRD
jgi:hypothetical protein